VIVFLDAHQIELSREHGNISLSVNFVGVFADPLGPEANVGIFIEDHKKRADSDPNAPPFDDLRNYAYEGGGSTAGSLSSLASGKSPTCHSK